MNSLIKTKSVFPSILFLIDLFRYSHNFTNNIFYYEKQKLTQMILFRIPSRYDLDQLQFEIAIDDYELTTC